MKEENISSHAVTKKRMTTTLFQAVKFGMVGVLNTAVDFAVFMFFTRAVGLAPEYAKVISYSAGVVNSYFFNSRWTFREQSRDTTQQKIRFVAVNLIACALAAGTVKLCVSVFGWVDWIANGASIAVTIAINFLGSKLFVFKAKR